MSTTPRDLLDLSAVDMESPQALRGLAMLREIGARFVDRTGTLGPTAAGTSTAAIAPEGEAEPSEGLLSPEVKIAEFVRLAPPNAVWLTYQIATAKGSGMDISAEALAELHPDHARPVQIRGWVKSARNSALRAGLGRIFHDGRAGSPRKTTRYSMDATLAATLRKALWPHVRKHGETRGASLVGEKYPKAKRVGTGTKDSSL